MRTLPLVLPAIFLAGAVGAQPRERTGEEVVKAQCVKCHEAGAHGAPRIDDRAAWAPRMKHGVDATVRSAIKGHGAMPARGGMADLTDTELRAAILYMFYPAGAQLKPAAPAPAARDPNHKRVEGIDIYLGVSPAAGRGQYYVNISLRDGASHAYIKDARVEARAANTMGGETKKLDPMILGESVSYGNVFRMAGAQPYGITVTVRSPASAPPIEARFEFTP